MLERRPIQCDEQAITHGKSYQWPAIKKACCLGAHLAFLDESGFLLIPTRRRTWALAGHTSILSYTYKHDRISSLAALTVSPKRQHVGLYIRFQAHNFQDVDVASFVRTLLRHLRGHVMLLWDRGAIHQELAIAALQKSDPRQHIEEFPADTPGLNPVEQI